MGPNEKAVRDTLAGRPASIINGASNYAQGCFAGMFNGALRRGHLHGSGLFIGKAECEWDWEKNWGELRDLGLLEWTTEEEPNHPKFGGFTTYVYPTITDRGREVREDDNKYFAALLAAMRADDEADTTPSSGKE